VNQLPINISCRLNSLRSVADCSTRRGFAQRTATLWLAALAYFLPLDVSVAGDKLIPEKAAEVFFNDYVLPTFKEHCFACHSHAAKKVKGGLVLDSRSGWVKGGDSGTAVVPGKPDESLLIQAVRYKGLEMPPTGKLPDETIAILERWVATGAFDPRVTEAKRSQESIDIDEGRQHWAFQPLRETSSPPVRDTRWPRTDVDRFILAKLEEQSLRPVRDADRHTWLRRVSLDLSGLPPTVEQLDAFLRDDSDQAEARVVDRLLESRAFGERFARHWLDLVGYADQIGTANDLFAEHAWRYRDYVIDSFHKDKPFDQFVREQLAGDLLPFDSPPQRAEQLTATGFLVLHDLTVVEADKPKLRIDTVDQQVDKVGRAFLGMTLGCARCHDHKFDPIPQRDYYALAGFFFSTESVVRAEWGVWSWPTVVELPETERQQAERLAQAERHRQRVTVLKAERDKLQATKAEIDATLKKDGAADDPNRVALTKIQTEQAERLKTLDRDIQHAEFFAPAPPRAFAVHDIAEPVDMQITIRGNAYTLGERVPRGFLQVASASANADVAIRASGRRELADWIVNPSNPLTARVAVNRIWQKLFGEGLVRSVDYFGLPGERPSHPELLDHLARQFVADGWSQKRLIRSLVLSRVYRLSSSESNAEAARVDPDNRLLWRMNRRRLDAEALRDTILLVSGRLIESHGGPSIPFEYPENTGGLGPKGVNPPFLRLNRFRPEQQFERTVYLPIIRSGPQAGPSEIRNVFDFTQPAEFAGQRPATAVPTQALFLMNSGLLKERARDLAERALAAGPEEPVRLDRLWLRVFNRPITDTERTDSAAFLAELRKENPTTMPDAELRCWAELCHALLASNEFLMKM
jgi:uncharacterized protein DUF1549/uncharacterized protein DUF1553/cytochrome c